MNLPKHVRWKDLTWRCSWVNNRQVRMATIEPGQNRICLIGISTFEAMLSSGEIVDANRGWE